jgi:hypothetical protein
MPPLLYSLSPAFSSSDEEAEEAPLMYEGLVGE